MRFGPSIGWPFVVVALATNRPFVVVALATEAITSRLL
jgi:hypothetical protein